MIICGSVSSMVSVGDLVTTANHFKCPLVIYLMDMEPFTGGCHYAWGCSGFKGKCQPCPAIWVPGLTSKIAFANQHDKVVSFADASRLFVAAGSTMLLEQAAASAVFRGAAKAAFIPLAVDLSLFGKLEQGTTRQKLGLELNDVVAYVGAVTLAQERKGFRLLIEALASVADKLPEKVIVLASGGDPALIRRLRAKVRVLDIGYQSTEVGLAEAYSAADFFVCPSIEDSGPQMVNEALASGRPVLAFDQGIARDFVVTGETGYLAKLGDRRDLAEGFLSLSTCVQLKDMGQRARIVADVHFSQKAQALAFCSLLDQ
jgi:glycosyltransferase involved in cell wall biosynthesis